MIFLPEQLPFIQKMQSSLVVILISRLSNGQKQLAVFVPQHYNEQLSAT
jgi:hypothetical protein